MRHPFVTDNTRHSSYGLLRDVFDFDHNSVTQLNFAGRSGKVGIGGEMRIVSATRGIIAHSFLYT